jgi:NADH:ubiquinone oxidoreductase subunit F (NADH-binding)
MTAAALLTGPEPALGMEGGAAHVARLGPLPGVERRLIDVLDRSELRGRGGASFPVGAKWQSIAHRSRGTAVVLANGAEGEALSGKDRLLMESRPHLVIDGAFLAARAVKADEVIFYIGTDLGQAAETMRRALAERGDTPARVRILAAPVRYVAGEESAAVHCANESVALPVTTPPRPYERGVGGHPTLVQNVETLAHVGLIARFGDAWFRDLGRDSAAGTALVTVSSGRPDRTVLEVAQGSSVGEAVAAAGRSVDGVGAVLLGGFFGGWVAATDAWRLPLDSVALRATGRSLGCGVIGLLGDDECGVRITARIAGYLAEQSAQQCGPCVFGLRAIAEALQRIAACRPEPHDAARVLNWAIEVRGRGACRHPDGAAGMVLSALQVFESEVTRHTQQLSCSMPPPVPGAGRWTW